MFLFLLISVICHERRSEGGMSLPWRFDANRLLELMRLGLPSALQTGLRSVSSPPRRFSPAA
jgi:Na+-driven multidrug efflux pump